jgi:hypothetical protein
MNATLIYLLWSIDADSYHSTPTLLSLHCTLESAREEMFRQRPFLKPKDSRGGHGDYIEDYGYALISSKILND